MTMMGRGGLSKEQVELAAVQQKLREQERIIMQQMQQQQQMQQMLMATQAQLLAQTTGAPARAPLGPGSMGGMAGMGGMGARGGHHAAGAQSASLRAGAAAYAPAGSAMQKRAREPAVPEPEEQPVEPLTECFLDEENGNVIVQLEGITIVSVSPSGEVVLNTGGWYTQDTVNAMNQALKIIGMKIQVEGEPEDGLWKVSDGSRLIRYSDDIVLPPKGNQTARRAQAILSWFQDPRGSAAAPQTQARGMAPVRPRAVEQPDAYRRLQSQGRY